MTEESRPNASERTDVLLLLLLTRSGVAAVPPAVVAVLLMFMAWFCIMSGVSILVPLAASKILIPFMALKKERRNLNQ